MSIKAIELNDIPGMGFKDCKAQADIFEFQKSGWPACEVESHDYSNAESARQAYKAAAERLRIGVTVVSRKNRLFLIRDTDNTVKEG